MKKSELFFSALQVPIDYIMIIISGLLAFYLRRTGSVQESYPILYQFSLRDYMELLLVMAAFFIIIYAIEGLYNTRSTKNRLRDIFQVTRATAIGLMIIIVVLFLNREWYSSRFVILAGGAFAVVLVSFGHMILAYLQNYFLVKKGVGVHRLLLVGRNSYSESIKKTIKTKLALGYVLVGHLDEIDLDEINKIRKQRGVDEIINCRADVVRKDLVKLKEFCIRRQIVFKYVPFIQTANFDFKIFSGEPLIEVKNTPLDGWGKITKRAFDIAGSFVAIILFSPILLIVAIITWIDSGKPVIYFNERVGHKGNFFLYKFRYMKKKYCHGVQFSAAHNRKALEYLDNLIKNNSIRKGPLYKIKDDPRKTKFGAFIEKYSLDEFPQFFNVFQGRMSLVGPRPHQPIEVEKYEDYQKRLFTIKPGVTGMAQVSGRSDLDFKKEAKLDIYYIENWSLWMDIVIIAKTFLVLLRGRRN
jgi:exopolysaccharide biosynthesis polyprenyl glycosylphosphotransferase